MSHELSWVEDVSEVLQTVCTTKPVSRGLFTPGGGLSLTYSALQTIFQQRQTVTGTLKEVARLFKPFPVSCAYLSGLPTGLHCKTYFWRRRRKVFCWLGSEERFVKIAYGAGGAREVREEVDAYRFLESKGVERIAPAHIAHDHKDRYSWLCSQLIPATQNGAPIPYRRIFETLEHTYQKLGYTGISVEKYASDLEGRIAKLEGGRRSVRVALHKAIEALNQQGVVMTWTHGDLGPSNIAIRGKEIFIIDWSTLGLRTAMYDAFELLRRDCTIEEAAQRVHEYSYFLHKLIPEDLSDRQLLSYYALALVEHEVAMDPELRAIPRILDHNRKQFEYVTARLQV